MEEIKNFVQLLLEKELLSDEPSLNRILKEIVSRMGNDLFRSKKLIISEATEPRTRIVFTTELEQKKAENARLSLAITVNTLLKNKESYKLTTKSHISDMINKAIDIVIERDKLNDLLKQYKEPIKIFDSTYEIYKMLIEETTKRGVTKALSINRVNQIIGRVVEDLSAPVILFFVKELNLENKDIDIIKHPNGSSNFPDYLIIDKSTKQNLIYFDSKGRDLKSSEVRVKTIVNHEDKSIRNIFRKMVAHPDGVSFTGLQIRRLIDLYMNQDIIKGTDSFYYLINRTSKKDKVVEISFDPKNNKYKSFHSERGEVSQIVGGKRKTHSFKFYALTESGVRKPLFRIEFMGGNIISPEDIAESKLTTFCKDLINVSIKQRN